jgi:hypothetical protein
MSYRLQNKNATKKTKIGKLDLGQSKSTLLRSRILDLSLATQLPNGFGYFFKRTAVGAVEGEGVGGSKTKSKDK